MDSTYLGAYWGDRPATPRECGIRLADCLERLASLDGSLAAWFRRGGSRSSSTRPVKSDPASLEELFEHGRNRREVGREPIDELGFQVGLWNRSNPAVGLSCVAGSYAFSLGVSNSFVLEFPRLDEASLALYDPAVAERIVEAVIDVWDPDWLTWTSHALRNKQHAGPREPVMGWATYIAAAESPAVRADVQKSRHGITIWTGRDVESATEATVERVRAQLAQDGVLDEPRGRF